MQPGFCGRIARNVLAVPWIALRQGVQGHIAGLQFVDQRHKMRVGRLGESPCRRRDPHRCSRAEDGTE